MERYDTIKEVGNGTFGSVWRAMNKQTGEVSCYYVAPSLRSKLAVVRTPPSSLSPHFTLQKKNPQVPELFGVAAGNRGSMQQKHVRRFNGNLSYYKPPDVQRKLNMDYQNTGVKQPPRYQPPMAMRNNPTTVHSWKTREVFNTAEKLSNMTIGQNSQSPGQLPPPPMKAGGWEPQSDPFLGRSQNFNHGQAYSRKVAG